MADKKMDHKKEFEKLFDEMTYQKGLSRKDAWSRLMLMFACDISNLTEPYPERKERRLKLFNECSERLDGVEIPTKMLGFFLADMSENPNQDFLGDLYMKLSMGERGWGQVFTPYHICELMARITMSGMADGDKLDEIENKGFVSVSDPCVGGGSMLIASAQVVRDAGYDVTKNMLAYGQDIDLTAVNMAYCQLAVLGIPAVIVWGNSLSEPYTGHPMFIEDNDKHWYTPALFTEAWHERRVAIHEKYKEKEAA